MLEKLAARRIEKLLRLQKTCVFFVKNIVSVRLRESEFKQHFVSEYCVGSFEDQE